MDKRAETAITTADKGATCEPCGCVQTWLNIIRDKLTIFSATSKAYTTENAYRSHINSKKHKENELKAALKASAAPTIASEEIAADEDMVPSAPDAVVADKAPEAVSEPSTSTAVPVVEAEAAKSNDEDDEDDEVMLTLEERIAAARNRIGVTSCLFCSSTAETIDANLEHMASVHSFFIPDADYLVDLPGLITYLGEKIAIGHVCTYCNGRGREFRSMHAVRKHMIDKSHCKLAYDAERDRLEISDFYDFTTSYPIASFKSNSRRKVKTLAAPPSEDGEEWEDEEEGADVVIGDGESVIDVDSEGTISGDEDDVDEANQLTYGDSPYELVLPSGARIGHRSMSRYYKQSFASPLAAPHVDPNSGAGLVRRLLADKNSALVPARGGFGAFGSGTAVIKARNRGEAKEAGRHIREFRDQNRREQFKTMVGFRGNYQKHFRDPLLQVC